MIISIVVLGVLGFVVSWYALSIEQKITRDPSYKPACDLSDVVSCSKPVLSPYGKLFGLSNALLGMGFYAVVCVLAVMHVTTLLFYMAIAACLVSVYLAGVLYCKIQAFCLLCTTIYALNAFLLLLSYLNF